jgi:hypothetical protein
MQIPWSGHAGWAVIRVAFKIAAVYRLLTEAYIRLYSRCIMLAMRQRLILTNRIPMCGATTAQRTHSLHYVQVKRPGTAFYGCRLPCLARSCRTASLRENKLPAWCRNEVSPRFVNWQATLSATAASEIP